MKNLKIQRSKLVYLIAISLLASSCRSILSEHLKTTDAVIRNCIQSLNEVVDLIRLEALKRNILEEQKFYNSYLGSISHCRSLLEHIENPDIHIKNLSMQLNIFNEHLKDRLNEIISEEEKRNKEHQNREKTKTRYHVQNIKFVERNNASEDFPEEKKYFDAKLLFLKEKKLLDKMVQNKQITEEEEKKARANVDILDYDQQDAYLDYMLKCHEKQIEPREPKVVTRSHRFVDVKEEESKIERGILKDNLERAKMIGRSEYEADNMLMGNLVKKLNQYLDEYWQKKNAKEVPIQAPKSNERSPVSNKRTVEKNEEIVNDGYLDFWNLKVFLKG